MALNIGPSVHATIKISLTPFDMRIIAHDPFISEDVAADLGVELVSLDDLFARSDFLSLHMPSTPTTKNIVNAERLARAKKGIHDQR